MPCYRTDAISGTQDRAASAANKRRSDGTPCRGHPLDQGKSDQTQAGFLARGSSLDTWPSQTSQDLASGPVADPLGGPGDRYAFRSPLTVAGTATDFTAFPI